MLKKIILYVRNSKPAVINILQAYFVFVVSKESKEIILAF